MSLRGLGKPVLPRMESQGRRRHHHRFSPLRLLRPLHVDQPLFLSCPAEHPNENRAARQNSIADDFRTNDFRVTQPLPGPMKTSFSPGPVSLSASITSMLVLGLASLLLSASGAQGLLQGAGPALATRSLNPNSNSSPTTIPSSSWARGPNSFLRNDAKESRGISPPYPSLDACHRQSVRVFLRRDEHDENHTVLYSSRSDSTDGGTSWWNKLVNLPSLLDPVLLTVDLIGVLVASQLLGLLDIINDPLFWYNGGWLQPIPAVPTTLGWLVTRIASLSVSWIIGSLLSKAMESEEDPNIDENSSVGYRLLYEASRTWVLFVAVRVAFTTSFLTQPLDAPTVLLQAYVVGLCVPAFRWILYGRI